MSIPINDTMEPRNGQNFPIVKAKDVEMPDGTRLSDFKGGVTSVNGQTGDVVIEVTNGKDGKDGAAGANGKDGFSPTVYISEIEGGHSVEITDVNGVQYFDVMDGKDGQGASITVDSELNAESENPVQNRVICGVLTEASIAMDQLAQAIPTDDHINSLIDAKLGVIENGSY